MKAATEPVTKYWPLIIVLAVVGAIVFVAPFMSLIVLAALMAFLFHPLYKKIGKRIANSGVAAGLTLLSSVVLIITPIAIVLFITAAQVIALASSVTAQYSNVDVSSLPDYIKGAVSTVNAALAPLSGQPTVITGESIVDFLKNTLPAILKGTVSIAVGIAGSIPVATILAIMYVILFCEFLIYGKKIIEILTHISPFDRKTTHLYFDRIGTMATAMVKGQFFISAVISALSAFLLIFLGMGQYFFLIFVLFTLLNLIPLGCGIVMIPIAIIAMLSGNFWPGLIVLFAYILVSNLDSVIRPRIIPKSVTLSAGLTALAAFGGIVYFGLIGVVYGPIIMIVIVSTITIYIDYRKQNDQAAAA
jgi:predicted PurR-regulated permease PerM